MSLSDKQRQVMDMELSRITILEGAISSGKTFIGNHKSIKHLANNYQGDGLVFFVGKTLDTLERNILHPLEQAYGQSYFSYRKGAKKANLCGIPIELEGCNDIRAEAKIRGTTAEFIYGDELTLWNEAFLTRCMGSLRTPNAKFLGTTNPDVPSNFVKKGWLDRKDELDLTNIKFNMEDNPSLTPEYIKEVQKEYQGIYHDRFIKGLWVQAEGLIYPMFNQDNITTDNNTPRGEIYYISIDYGTKNPFSMGLWKYSDGIATRVREYYYSGKDSRNPKTDQSYYHALEEFAGDTIVQSVIVDPSAASFIQAIREAGKFNVRLADNEVQNGIRRTASLIYQKRLLVHESCENTISEFGEYRWDERPGVEKPIEENDHAMDDTRYFVNTILKHEIGIDLAR